PTVDEDRLLRAVCVCTLGHRCDVRLVILPEIGREGVRHRAALAHPRERAAGVEPAGERDPDPFAYGEGGEDHALRLLSDAHAHAAARCCRSSSASCAPVAGSRATSKTVFSPAIV